MSCRPRQLDKEWAHHKQLCASLATSMTSSDHLEEEAAAFVARVKNRGIKVVVYDMDQCLVARHSRGRLRR